MFYVRLNESILFLVVAGVLASGVLSSTSAAAPANIPQPKLGDLKHLPVAPLSKRVDLKAPKFSDPTKITHPLFPVTAPSVVSPQVWSVVKSSCSASRR